MRFSTPRPPESHRRRLPSFLALVTLVLALLVGLLVVGAGPAAAHPIPPGYNPLLPSPVSISVDSVRPDLIGDAFVLEPDGGLAQFLLTAKPGHDIVVLGYNDEPYLHIDAEGKVFTNTASSSTYINSTSTSDGTVPPNLSPSSPPEWQLTPTATAATVIWHDHRIHWMQTGPPAPTAGNDVIQNWQIKLVVDQTPVTVTGALHRVPDVPWSNYQIALGTTTDPPTTGPPVLFWLIAGTLAIFAAFQAFVFVRNHRRLTAARRRSVTARKGPADDPTDDTSALESVTSRPAP